MYQNIPTKVLTGEVRLSYVHLTQPYAGLQGGEPKYQATLLIPKTDVNTYNDIIQSRDAAYEDGVKNKWKGARPQLKSPLIWDGDGVNSSGMPFGDECKGHWVITASCSQQRKPQVVGIDNVRVELAPQDIYSGMYARVTINFFPFDSHGNKGVGCGLGNVMKTRDGEPLSGGASAESDFGSFAPQQVPQMGYAQPQNAVAGATPAQYAAPTMGTGQTYQPMAALQGMMSTAQPQQPAVPQQQAPQNVRFDPITGQYVPF